MNWVLEDELEFSRHMYSQHREQHLQGLSDENFLLAEWVWGGDGGIKDRKWKRQMQGVGQYKILSNINLKSIERSFSLDILRQSLWVYIKRLYI